MADEIIDFRDFQKKMNPKIITFVVIGIFIVITIFSSFYLVDQKEEAVVLLLGKYSRITGPGLHFKLPFGLEKNYNVPTQRVLKMEFGYRTAKPGVKTEFIRHGFKHESEMLTGDLNIMDVHWIIQYRIINPRYYLFNVEDQYKTISDISQSVINQQVGDRTIFDVIGSERTNIEQNSLEMMNMFFEQFKLGVSVTTVQLQKTDPPTGEVYSAFQDVIKAKQDRDRLINEGKESYNKLIPKTRGEAQQIIQESEGYAIERVNDAKGDVARFLAVHNEYKKSPRVTRLRLYYEMIEKVFSKTEETDIIDKYLRNFVPFKSLTAQKKGDNQ
jgi:membrane protease subunit HflK